MRWIRQRRAHRIYTQHNKDDLSCTRANKRALCLCTVPAMLCFMCIYQCCVVCVCVFVCVFAHDIINQERQDKYNTQRNPANVVPRVQYKRYRVNQIGRWLLLLFTYTSHIFVCAVYGRRPTVLLIYGHVLAPATHHCVTRIDHDAENQRFLFADLLSWEFKLSVSQARVHTAN